MLAPLLSAFAGDFPVTEVANGFTWAENLVCVPDLTSADDPALFVSENFRGELWMVRWNQTAGYVQTKHAISAHFKLFAGLATDPESGRVFVLGNEHDSNSCVLAEPSTRNSSFSLLATLPVPYCRGEGLALHRKTGLLYASYEGDFLPSHGKIFRIDPQVGTVEAVVDLGNAYDGVFIDQSRDLLYVSEVKNGTISLFDIAAPGDPVFVSRLSPNASLFPNPDDFTLDDRGKFLLVAEITSGKVIQVTTTDFRSAEPAKVIAAMKSPTSVRWGCTANPSHGLRHSLAFVTEGCWGCLIPVTDRRVLAVDMSAALSVPETP